MDICKYVYIFIYIYIYIYEYIYIYIYIQSVGDNLRELKRDNDCGLINLGEAAYLLPNHHTRESRQPRSLEGQGILAGRGGRKVPTVPTHHPPGLAGAGRGETTGKGGTPTAGVRGTILTEEKHDYNDLIDGNHDVIGFILQEVQGVMTYAVSSNQLECIQGYLAHKKQPPPLRPPLDLTTRPTVGSYGGAVSYERGTPVQGGVAHTRPCSPLQEYLTNKKQPPSLKTTVRP